jgi:hypothetical protein
MIIFLNRKMIKILGFFKNFFFVEMDCDCDVVQCEQCLNIQNSLRSKTFPFYVRSNLDVYFRIDGVMKGRHLILYGSKIGYKYKDSITPIENFCDGQLRACSSKPKCIVKQKELELLSSIVDFEVKDPGF